MTSSRLVRALGAAALITATAPLLAQVDQNQAATYFRDATVLCQREGGRTWGASLCGPMAFVDRATQTIATNEPVPSVKQPPGFGLANAAMDWGGTRWTTIVWMLVPPEPGLRNNLMLHELFHRIQPQLGLLLPDPASGNVHLDTPDGRYWIQLEWRALARALILSGPARTASVRDALAFRGERHRLFPGSDESERVLEVNEGLAQYTATIAATDSHAEAVADAIDQLTRATLNQTFVRTFPYASGASYGLLLDDWSPGWPRRFKATDDFGALVMAAAKITPAPDPNAAAKWYGGPSLRLIEARREAEQQTRVADLRKRFVDGPVLVLPASHNNAFVTNGITAVPGVGVAYPSFHANADWGVLDANTVLMSSDQSTLTVPAPAVTTGSMIRGDGWALTIAAGWVIRPGTRPGDYRLVRE